MFGRIAEAARDLLCLTPQIYLNGSREMLIESCRRIEEYNDVRICVTAGSMSIQIWGSSLRTETLRTGGLIIRGRISSIEFSERSVRNEKTAKGIH